MRTHWRKILRDVRANKTRTLMVSLSIFVGTLGVVALTTLGQLLTQQLEEDIREDELAMLKIYVHTPDAPNVDNRQVFQRISQLSGVQSIEGQAVYQQSWKLPGDADYQTGELFAYSESYGNIQMEPPRLIAGDYPRIGRNEIAVEQRMAEKHGLSVGDTLVLRTSGRAGRQFVPVLEEEWTIVGLLFQPYLYVGSQGADYSLFATLPDAEHLVGFVGYSSLFIRFDDFTTALEQSLTVRTTLEETTPYVIIFHLIDNPAENSFLVGARRFRDFLLALALLALTVSGFLVTNIVSNVVAEQRRQIGTLKSVGATRLDIFIIYSGLALTYGLIGTIPAMLIGIPLGNFAVRTVAPLANTLIESTPPQPFAIALGLAAGLLMPVVAGLIPVLHATRISILEAITDLGIQSRYGQRSFLARLIKRVPMPISLHHSLNSILRKRARLAISILALTLATAAFMGVFALFFSLNQVLGNIRDQLDYQLSLQSSELLDTVQELIARPSEGIRTIQPGVAIELELVPDPAEANDEAEAEDGVLLPLEEVMEIAMDNPQDRLFVTGIDTIEDQDIIQLEDGSGWERNPDRRGVVITPEIAEELSLEVGDSLDLALGQRAEAFEVIGIAPYPLRTAFMEWNQLAEFVGTLPDAPTPNAYWETLTIESGDDDENVWTVGVDRDFGNYLSSDFSSEEPGIILTRELADSRGYDVGDEIRLSSNENSEAYPIIEIVDVPASQLRLVTRDIPEEVLSEAPPVMVMALFWEHLADLSGLDYDELAPDTVYIDLANPEREDSTQPLPVFNDQIAFAERITQTVLSVGLILNLASLLMAVVGGIGLLTILSMSVIERQREIGVMKSVGASGWIIASQFVLEGWMVGLLAWLLGVPLSYLLSALLIRLVPFSEVVSFSYPSIAPLIGLIQIIVVASLASSWPALSAGRRTVSDILRYM